MRPMRIERPAALLLAALAGACSATNETIVGPSETTGSSSGTGGSAGGPGAGGAGGFDTGLGGATGGAGPSCAERAKLVYVLSEENALYSFSPPDLTFSLIGALQCPAGGASP